MAFIDPVTLEGKHVRIEPLARGHEEGVKSAASDGELWRLWYTSVPAPAKTGEWIDAALDMRERLQRGMSAAKGDGFDEAHVSGSTAP